MAKLVILYGHRARRRAKLNAASSDDWPTTSGGS